MFMQDKITEIEELKNQIANLENWFNSYDIQVIQYARDIRSKGESSIDIISLDNDAYSKAEELKKLRNELTANLRKLGN